MGQNEKAEFTIIYEGDALQDNAIDVKDLAPALLSIGDIFQQSNHILNGDDVEIKIYVKATEKGSFQIDFSTIQSAIEQVKSFLTGDYIVSAINLKELIFFGLAGAGGLFWLIKKIKGKNPDKISDIGNGIYRITAGDETIDVPLKTLKLYKDLSIRKAAEGIVAPLRKNGIDKIRIKDKSNDVEVAQKSDVIFFNIEQSDMEETVLDIERRQAFSIVSLSFKEDNKWRLNDGNTQISVKIKDAIFLEKVNKGLISFSKGDILLCRIKSVQKNTLEGLKSEYELLEVLEHRRSSIQPQLFKID
jgi:hypothetical protein